jgi:cell division protein FtsI (penicillin-binding protein 3)
MPFQDKNADSLQAVRRVRTWYALLIFIVALFGVRLFYLQIIRFDHYKKAALSDQLKQYEIPPTRGLIEAYDGSGSTVPIVLNQRLYTLYTDPTFVKNPDKVATDVSKIVGGHASDYMCDLTAKNTRYRILAKKLTQDQQNKITALKYPGLGTQEQDYRTYPQGALASQVLGFVNDDGKGVYGIEQDLNNQLKGTPGELKAITDLKGVPLAASSGNIERAPKEGNDIVLTLDLGIQQQLESILADGTRKDKADSASALIMDANTGAVKAMANFPSYDPAQYQKVDDVKLFNNAAVSQPIEVGSIMKTLTTSAALDQGVITPNTTYSDPSHWLVDGFNITNIEEDGGPGTRSIADILNLSLNTGATWELMQMGGGDINTKARNAWYDYMTNHFRLGKPTGVEQGYEASGVVPGPQDNGAGIDLTYANTAFGQAMTATPIQMAAALSSVLNGGTYYQPHLVDKTIDAAGKTTSVKPKVVQQDVVSRQVGQAMIPLMQYVVDHHDINPPFDQSKYMVGGKTGTAQIAKPGGGYHEDEFNGTYLGFVGGDKVQYVIAVFVEKPHVAGYAGAGAAQPIFARLAHMLIDNSYVNPRS